ncbi:hypothetical protein SVIO_096190 [Streptomyces violaceusniger]|uniref:Thiolase-like protein type 1 additional C-terminal domain-containing protein n=1 Tax=Streptomyces violaceusniger TaxID=68280 RepID=A0A4D4LI88_STRVO|nr:hypothetical protein SVIO_096190 [Streptomyces violaceusniger]
MPSPSADTDAPDPLDDLDPRTPVLVGVGQSSERIDDADYRRRSPVELAADAAREALADAAADGGAEAVAAAIDTVAGVRQFEISQPTSVAPLGRSNNYPRSVARRLGADPARAILEVAGGQSPQHLVNELAATIAAGSAEAVLVFGSEAISTTGHLAASEPAEDRPDFTEHVEGSLEDRGYGLKGLVSRHLSAHGLTGAPHQYALFENARRARLGLTREQYAASMGALFAPFTEVAAANPHASAPTVRSAEELVTVTPKNRIIVDPYPRYVVARDKVNQGAAALLMSLGTARRLGVPQDKWLFLHGHADLRERDLMERQDLSSAPASVAAARHALEVAGITTDDLATIDLYSCFPIAVTNICDGLGLDPADPRGLTVTGGLPFFGGAGNNYSMHAIAETAHRLRAAPGGYGLVGANGGNLSKYSVAVYSTTPAPGVPTAAPNSRPPSTPSRPRRGPPRGRLGHHRDLDRLLRSRRAPHRYRHRPTGGRRPPLHRQDGRRRQGPARPARHRRSGGHPRVRALLRPRQPRRLLRDPDDRALPAPPGRVPRYVRTRHRPPRGPPPRGHHQPPRGAQQPPPHGQRGTRRDLRRLLRRPGPVGGHPHRRR